MVDIKKTTAFDAWMKSLKDGNARGRIAARIDRLASGNPGDAKLLKESGGGTWRDIWQQKNEQRHLNEK
jgi:putative addiction module killer protein